MKPGANQTDETGLRDGERERVIWVRTQAFVALLGLIAIWTLTLQFFRKTVELEENQLPMELIVDLNAATQAELNLLPGVGEKLASDILKYRDEVGGFHSVDELMNIRGIKEGRLLSLKKNVKVGGELKTLK